MSGAWMELDANLEPVACDVPEQPDVPQRGIAPAPAFDRRGFLKLGGLAAASLAACQRLPVRHAIPLLVPDEGITPGVSIPYATTCTACPAACGMVAVVRDGRPVKLEGHPGHALSRGGLCALGQGDLRALYDGGRLRGPRLAGAESSWDALDARVRAGLEEARRAGLGVALLVPPLSSPSLRAAADAFAAAWDGTLVEWDPDPEAPRAVLDAYAALDGVARRPWLRLEEAEILVTIGADLFGTGGDPVADAAARAAARRAAHAAGRSLRHVCVEGSLSLTGAAADERWSATGGERRAVALGLLRELASADEALRESLGDAQPPERFAAKVAALGAALRQAPGRGLLVAGGDDPVVALAVAIANRSLGSEGRTLDLARPALARRGGDAELAGLLDRLHGGELGALVVVELDPVDQLAEGPALAEALQALPLSVVVGSRPTATAAACTAVAAAHHGLESWGDFAPRPDVLTLAQPAVRPLFDTRSALASLLRWAGAEPADDLLFLRERWRREVFPLSGEADFERFWTEAVARGSGPAAPGAELAASPAADPARVLAETRAVHPDPAADASGLEVELIAEVALRDGSRAHVPWLRELPDPLTRVAWSACVRVAPERARAEGLADGDRIEVATEAGRVVMPVRVLPGQHPQVLGVPVGYGRADGDPERPEQNGYRLAVRGRDGWARRGLPARLARAGGREPLPLVQVHPSAEGRPIVHQVGSATEAVHGAHVPEGRDLWPEPPKPSPQWGMAIDLDACTGCSACVVACQAENNVAVVGPGEVRRNRGMHWLRIDRYFAGSAGDPDVLFEPMLCAQCEHAPCETVCPVAATVHSEDGLNQQVYNRCVGTRYCANNCPYKVRAFNWLDYDPGGPLERLVLNPDVVVRSRGVMEKCTFCVQRIQAARIAARAEGRTGVPEVQTACQQSCPSRAIHFGDAADPEGEIRKLREEPRAFRVLAELGVEPSVSYLAKVRHRAGQAGHHEEEA